MTQMMSTICENDASDAMRQALYWLTLRLELENGTVSDTVAARFGVREIHSEVDPMLQGHVFYVNRQRVSSWCLLMMARQQHFLMCCCHTRSSGLLHSHTSKKDLEAWETYHVKYVLNHLHWSVTSTQSKYCRLL